MSCKCVFGWVRGDVRIQPTESCCSSCRFAASRPCRTVQCADSLGSSRLVPQPQIFFMPRACGRCSSTVNVEQRRFGIECLWCVQTLIWVKVQNQHQMLSVSHTFQKLLFIRRTVAKQLLHFGFDYFSDKLTSKKVLFQESHFRTRSGFPSPDMSLWFLSYMIEATWMQNFKREVQSFVV